MLIAYTHTSGRLSSNVTERLAGKHFVEVVGSSYLYAKLRILTGQGKEETVRAFFTYRGIGSFFGGRKKGLKVPSHIGFA